MAYRIYFGSVVLECDTPAEVLEAVRELNRQEQLHVGKSSASEESK